MREILQPKQIKRGRAARVGEGALKWLCAASIVGMACSQSNQESPTPTIPNIPDTTTPDTTKPKTTIPDTTISETTIPDDGGALGFTSIDTMKTSRDRAREGVSKEEIDYLVSEVAKTGATHVAIGTPYDEEFIPVLTQWVESAREHGLSVWFRGNFSGWEEWFGYEPFTDPQQHLDKLREFIISHKDLFREGDIFTPCPEPENGYKSEVIDPFWESAASQEELRDFLVDEYNVCEEAFTEIGMAGKVAYGCFSMNGDVAKALTREVVNKIGNVVVIDHYVADYKKMGQWIRDLRDIYGEDVRIIIGEMGAPVPDLNGDMTELEQAQFIDLLFQQILLYEVSGVNYWVLMDGSTALLNHNDSEKMAHEVVGWYYSGHTEAFFEENPLRVAD